MPHIILEHSGNAAENLPALLADLHQTLSVQDTVNIAAIKTRAVAVEHAIVGDSEGTEMLHITLKLLPGRDDELRAKMTQALKAVAVSHVAEGVCVTVESALLDAPSYCK